MPQQFDLEKAKAGHPLVTSGGTPAKFIAHIPECGIESRVIALIHGNKSPDLFCEDGAMYEDQDSRDDLFLADPPKVKKERWVTLSVDSAGRFATHDSISKDHSETMAISCGYRVLGSTLINWEDPAS